MKHGRAAGIRLIIACFLLLVQQFASSSAAVEPAAIEPDEESIVLIIGCLHSGREAVLLVSNVECKEYREGAKFLRSHDSIMPLAVHPNQLCSEDKGKTHDYRKLSGNAIKRIAAQKTSLDPTGVRILGAIFCERLDLRGLELNYALVMDYSLFNQGIDARNFRVHGDFSFDNSSAWGEIRFSRSRIEGSIYGSDAFIKKLQILDSEVYGSLNFRRSFVLEPIVFDTVLASGELSLRQSALSYVLLQFSNVGGVLDLSGSQARCAYLISKSEIGDLVVVNAGFGVSGPAVVQPSEMRLFRPDHAPRMLFFARQANGRAPPFRPAGSV